MATPHTSLWIGTVATPATVRAQTTAVPLPVQTIILIGSATATCSFVRASAKKMGCFGNHSIRVGGYKHRSNNSHRRLDDK